MHAIYSHEERYTRKTFPQNRLKLDDLQNFSMHALPSVYSYMYGKHAYIVCIHVYIAILLYIYTCVYIIVTSFKVAFIPILLVRKLKGFLNQLEKMEVFFYGYAMDIITMYYRSCEYHYSYSSMY